MQAPPAHPGIDHAFTVLLNGDSHRTGSAIADLASYAGSDAQAAVHLNVVLNRAGHEFFGSLAPADQKMLGSVLVRAALVIAAAYPDEAATWNDAATKWRAFVDKPLAKPERTAALERSLRGRFR